MVQISRTQVMAGAQKMWSQMGRTKTLSSDAMDTPLNRCLTTVDITLLGIGHMVGAGIYVLTGTVAKDMAGPAIIFSFILAGFVSLLSALCYAEFGARVPKAGSAYVYTYVTIGEFWAFVIGWTIILEHAIGAASVARAWSGYVDSLLDHAISNVTLLHIGDTGVLASHADPLAFTVTIIYCCLLALGVKGSAYFNSVFTLVNMCVMLFVVCVGLFWADISNWSTPGGFAPFGFSGVIAGAATSFYAFVGFDSIATSGEEALHPARSIPIATIVSLSVVTLGYVLVGGTLTLMVPYNEVNPSAALADAFDRNGVIWAKYLVSIGALCGMTTTLFGSLFSLPRCIYAMASDGLLFSWMAKVSDTTQVPVINMVLSGLLTAFVALLFDIETLVEFMSIGTLLAYTIVSASVVILRYQPAGKCNIKSSSNPEIPPTPITPAPDTGENMPEEDPFGQDLLRPSFSFLSHWIRPELRGEIVAWFVFGFTIFSSLLFTLFLMEDSSNPSIWSILGVLTLIILMAICVFVISIHRQNGLKLSFSVPFVPFVPLFSICCNVGLMIHLNPLTWVRFIVWMLLGLLVYFSYGVHHSRETEPVSAYSTLITENKPASSTVFGSVQEKISQVSSKILSNATMENLRPSEDTYKEYDREPIIDKEDPEN